MNLVTIEIILPNLAPSHNQPKVDYICKSSWVDSNHHYMVLEFNESYYFSTSSHTMMGWV